MGDPGSTGAACHILLLDDDPGVLLLQRRHLERSGYRVTGVASPDEAMRAVHEHSGFDLVVLDFRLGTAQTGLDFYRSLRSHGYDLPAVLVTAFSDESRAIDALRAGVRDVVPKSGDYLDYLPEAVERVLRQVRTEREAAESEALRQSRETLRETVEKFQTLADNIA